MLPRKGLPPEVKAEIWKRHVEQGETLIELSSDYKISYGQAREAIRDFRHGTKAMRRRGEIMQVRTDTQLKREEILSKLEELINAADASTKNKLEGIKAQILVLDSIDRFEGKGAPRTQVNIIQIRLEAKLDEVLKWVAVNLAAEQRDSFKGFLVNLDKQVDGVYALTNGSV